MPSSLAVQAPADLSAARDFARRVALAWPLQSAMLFGSQARGNAHVGSDTDVAVLLQGKPGDFVATKLALNKGVKIKGPGSNYDVENFALARVAHQSSIGGNPASCRPCAALRARQSVSTWVSQ